MLASILPAAGIHAAVHAGEQENQNSLRQSLAGTGLMSGVVWKGSGVSDDPYLVESAAHLDDVRSRMSENGGAVCFLQTADIDLSGYPSWTPIGNDSSSFKGIYDGNGKTISDLTIKPVIKLNLKNEISDYAVKCIAALVKDGLIAGTGNKLNPRAYTTRAEAAVFLYRIYNY